MKNLKQITVGVKQWDGITPRLAAVTSSQRSLLILQQEKYMYCTCIQYTYDEGWCKSQYEHGVFIEYELWSFLSKNIILIKWSRNVGLLSGNMSRIHFPWMKMITNFRIIASTLWEHACISIYYHFWTKFWPLFWIQAIIFIRDSISLFICDFMYLIKK